MKDTSGLRYKGMSYETWMEAVNKALLAICGMDSDFLPDWNSLDAWNADMPPDEAAQEWYEDAQTY